MNADRSDEWEPAEAGRLLDRLGRPTAFNVRYRADNETGSKDQAPLEWFERLAAGSA